MILIDWVIDSNLFFMFQILMLDEATASIDANSGYWTLNFDLFYNIESLKNIPISLRVNLSLIPGDSREVRVDKNVSWQKC